MSGNLLNQDPRPSAEWFRTTHWSVVLAARGGHDTQARTALDLLCRSYWYPIYAFLRRQGSTPEDAEDLTQGFFEHVLEHNTLDRVAREKGRFRSFLLASLKYFISDQRARERRQKRGGGKATISLDAATAEQRYQLEPRDDRTPEQLYERRWALALLDRVLSRLREEYVEADQTSLFDALQPFLAAKQGGEPYVAIAARLGRSEEAIKKAVQRMRQRYQKLFREEIAQTVSTPEKVEDELRHLCELMGGG